MNDRASSGEHVWFSGNYATWQEAQRNSIGYDAPLILERVRAATLKVIAGEVACERDAVTFPRIQYSLPLLVCLLYVASRCENRLHVIDVGGSLGSSYWQNRGFLGHMPQMRWSIVEQPHFVAVGRQEIQNDTLRFHVSIDECFEAPMSPNAVLLSGLLQYLDTPHLFVARLLEKRVPFVILDRTPFFVADLPDRITVERVPPEVYEASYPSWFFNLPRLREVMERRGYTVLEEFDSWERWNVDGDPVQNKCLLLERRNANA